MQYLILYMILFFSITLVQAEVNYQNSNQLQNELEIILDNPEPIDNRENNIIVTGYQVNNIFVESISDQDFVQAKELAIKQAKEIAFKKINEFYNVSHSNNTNILDIVSHYSINNEDNYSHNNQYIYKAQFNIIFDEDLYNNFATKIKKNKNNKIIIAPIFNNFSEINKELIQQLEDINNVNVVYNNNVNNNDDVINIDDIDLDFINNNYQNYNSNNIIFLVLSNYYKNYAVNIVRFTNGEKIVENYFFDQNDFIKNTVETVEQLTYDVNIAQNYNLEIIVPINTFSDFTDKKNILNEINNIKEIKLSVMNLKYLKFNAVFSGDIVQLRDQCLDLDIKISLHKNNNKIYLQL